MPARLQAANQHPAGRCTCKESRDLCRQQRKELVSRHAAAHGGRHEDARIKKAALHSMIRHMGSVAAHGAARIAPAYAALLHERMHCRPAGDCAAMQRRRRALTVRKKMPMGSPMPAPTASAMGSKPMPSPLVRGSSALATLPTARHMVMRLRREGHQAAHASKEAPAEILALSTAERITHRRPTRPNYRPDLQLRSPAEHLDANLGSQGGWHGAGCSDEGSGPPLLATARRAAAVPCLRCAKLCVGRSSTTE